MCTKPFFKATMGCAAASCLLVAYALAQPGQPGQSSQAGQQGAQSGQFGQGGQQGGQFGQGGQQGGQNLTPPAQPPSGANQRTATGQSQQGARSSNSEIEQYFAACLLTKNEGEVELAKFAEQRSQNPQVKQFAQTLVADHQAAIQKIQRIAGNQSVSSTQDRGVQPAGFTQQSESSQQSGATSQSSGANRSMDRAGGSNSSLQQLAAIEKQIAERCQQELREKLQSKQGAEFDHCFIASQIFGHIEMAAALEVIQSQTTGQLSQIAQESQPKVKHHLEMAEKLGEQLMAANRQADGQQPTTSRAAR